MTLQLREYMIRHGMLEEWLEVWHTKVVPGREKYGFKILGAWVDKENVVLGRDTIDYSEMQPIDRAKAEKNDVGRDGLRFVWLVSHDGDFLEAERAYYSGDEKMAGIYNDDHRLCVGVRMGLVDEVPYKPSRT